MAATTQYIGDGGTEGTVIGKTTSYPLGFYGATPVTQPTSSNQAAVASTAVVSFAATPWGFATSAQAQGVITLLTEIRTQLVALGLIKGS